MKLGRTTLLAAGVVFSLLTLHCAPHPAVTPVSASAPSAPIGSLDDLMGGLAAAAEPQFAKIGQNTFSDAELAELTRVGVRVQADGVKAKAFSRGAEFDGFAARLEASGKALEEAAKAKDPAASSLALANTKATCDACHSTFR